MSRYDQKILFTALAFMAVVQKDGKKADENHAQKVMALAGLINNFCTENIPSFTLPISAVNDDKEAAAKLDMAIERYIKELRENETTVLPEEKDSLMQIYVRLQFRTIHRINAVLFSEISPSRLADHVLSQLDEEIQYQEGLS
jgi:hypothetical protein